MKIRWKLLLILLAFSLIPLLVMRIHSVNSLTSLGKDLQNQTRITLLDRTMEDFTHLSNSIAEIINIEGRLYRTSLKSIQIRAEQLLNDNETLGTKLNPFIITPEKELNTPKLAPDPNYKKLNLRRRQMMSGKSDRPVFSDLPISKTNISFWIPEGLDVSQVMPLIKKLEPLLLLFQSCNGTLEDLFLWLEINLDNGLTVSYPAHNSFPHKYDPRISHWYKELKKTRQTSWSLPTTDPATRSLVHRLTTPLLDKEGHFIGSASIVVPVDSPVDHKSITRFTGEMSTFLVSTNFAAPQKDRLLILGKYGSNRKIDSGSQPMGHFWQTPEREEWLYEESPEFKTLVTDIKNMNPGVLQMPFAGKQSLWTYNPVNNGLAILLVTPTATLTREADAAEQYVKSSISSHIYTVTIIFGVTILTLLASAYLLSMGLSTPIRKISAAVNRIAKGDWSTRVDINSTDELGELADTFNHMVPQLKERAAILQALSLADEAQKNFLPDKMPELERADIAASCVFSEKTGGDYYDLVDSSICGKDKFAMSIGDVSGHGIAAALLMTTAGAYLRALTGSYNLVEIVKKTNRLLSRDCAKSSNFITMMTAVCNLDKMTLKWIRAGHDPGMLYTPETDEFRELIGEGLALGIDPDYDYEENVTRIEPGQVLVLYTDGICEAHSPAGLQFGKTGIKQTIRDNWEKPAEMIVKKMQAEVKKHCAELPTEDDYTVIVVKFL
ncbi:SpoIIE family protein phosphatase [Maridesulfovibrio bastinii]|uniref:SpoIIE family protein phosphatase n=1 Tax=Maridesulfovibrio bastinii TaxID=47157 RepID=UPI00040A4EF6|nr:SpoIIE family protein phosphatase [Maridesulfovibrio bastinii]